jgi:hypothetical protein
MGQPVPPVTSEEFIKAVVLQRVALTTPVCGLGPGPWPVLPKLEHFHALQEIYDDDKHGRSTYTPAGGVPTPP